MPDITASAAQVGETLIQALQTALGLGPEAALAQAQADNGVTTEDIDNADLGEVFDYVCGQPDLSPELQLPDQRAEQLRQRQHRLPGWQQLHRWQLVRRR